WLLNWRTGPSENTHVVLDYFRSVRMNATFWVIGAQVTDYPDVLAKTVKDGHEVGLHTWSHPDLTKISQDQVIAELVYAAKAVFEVIGLVPRYFRPPYGAINNNVRQTAAMMGLQAVTWSKDSGDWSYISNGGMAKVPQAFQSWVDQNLTRAITLEHDLYPQTVAVVKQSMDILVNAGRVIKPLSECIGVSDVYHNPILQGFFQAGQFESRDKVLPVVMATALPTSTLGTTSTTAFMSMATTGTAVVDASGTGFTTGLSGHTTVNQSAASDIMSVGAIVGITVAMAVIILVFIILLYARTRRQQSSHNDGIRTDSTTPFGNIHNGSQMDA
ncbi:hypothetical protein BC830DRAFT_1065055, partial [Chytriomyces sp. MP71]